MKHPPQLNWALKTKLKLDDIGKFSFEVRYFRSAEQLTKVLSEKPGISFWNADCCIPPAHNYNHIHPGIVHLFLPFQELTFHFPRQYHICTGSTSPSPQPKNPHTDRVATIFLYHTICKTNTSKQKGSNSSTTGFTSMTTSYGQRTECGKTLNLYSWALSLDGWDTIHSVADITFKILKFPDGIRWTKTPNETTSTCKINKNLVIKSSSSTSLVTDEQLSKKCIVLQWKKFQENYGHLNVGRH